MPEKQQNVLVILSDDLGWFDVGCYNQGMMGPRPPTSTGSRPRVSG
jgi:arylsulfatase A-like enzyme